MEPRTDILEGLSTGVQIYVSAPHLMHKWLHKSLSHSFMLLKSGSFFFFCAPRPSMPQKVSVPLKLPVSLRLAALEPPFKSYANRMVPFSFYSTL